MPELYLDYIKAKIEKKQFEAEDQPTEYGIVLSIETQMHPPPKQDGSIVVSRMIFSTSSERNAAFEAILKTLNTVVTCLDRNDTSGNGVALLLTIPDNTKTIIPKGGQ